MYLYRLSHPRVLPGTVLYGGTRSGEGAVLSAETNQYRTDIQAETGHLNVPFHRPFMFGSIGGLRTRRYRTHISKHIPHVFFLRL